MNDKITLYLVNGALGAGKTTLVDFLVQQPEFAGARVVENEFASESIDSCTPVSYTHLTLPTTPYV